MNHQRESKSHGGTVTWRFAGVGLIAVSVAAVSVQSIQTNHLRELARSIRIGEDILQVDKRLGSSAYSYSWWSSPGAPSKESGAVYGGSLNTMHEKLNSLVSRTSLETQWYNTSLSQHPKDWPVLIMYNSERLVTAVIIDGDKVTPAPVPQTPEE